MNYAPTELFGIETNDDFHWSDTDASTELIEVARGFGFAATTRMQALAKRNPNSRMFRVFGPDWNLIVRGVSESTQATLEQQCRLANLVAFPAFIKPLAHATGGYSVARGGQAWMAYREEVGVLFTGRDCAIEAVVEAAMDFQNALRDVQRSVGAAELDHIPSATHRQERWHEFFATLCNGSATGKWANLRGLLTKTSRELLDRNLKSIQACIDEFGTLAEAAPALTHNDLQHANVLVRAGSPFFLDIEDVCFERREIAISHAVFKLLRHTVYAGVYTAHDVRTAYVSPILSRLVSKGFAIPDRKRLFAYGAYRIISDIWEIADCALSQDDHSQLYDLDKRIQNLFELHHLLS